MEGLELLAFELVGAFASIHLAGMKPISRISV